MTDAMQVKEALEKILATSNDFGKEPIKLTATHFLDKIAEIRAIAESTLSAPSPAALDPVTVRACADIAERHAGAAAEQIADKILALLAQPAPTGESK